MHDDTDLGLVNLRFAGYREQICVSHLTLGGESANGHPDSSKLGVTYPKYGHDTDMIWVDHQLSLRVHPVHDDHDFCGIYY